MSSRSPIARTFCSRRTPHRPSSSASAFSSYHFQRERERKQAELKLSQEEVRRIAAFAERERIGRQVHDGVLQALALINRRGREIGGEGEALADLAADQERARAAARGMARTKGVRW